MALAVAFFILLHAHLGVAGANHASDTQCNADETCKSSNSPALLQHRIQSHSVTEVTSDVNETSHVYGPNGMEGSLIEYFKWWSQGRVRGHLNSLMDEVDDGDNLMETEFKALSSTDVIELFSRTRQEECADFKGHSGAGQRPLNIVEVGDEAGNGVRHMLLKDQSGRLQYLAIHDPNAEETRRVIVADPPVCASLLQEEKKPAQGSEQMLSLEDPAVKDCKQLLEKTFKENCGGKEVTVEVYSATVEVIDGVEVSMTAKICEGTACQEHAPKCLFETSLNHTDASLLEATISEQHDVLKDLKGTVELSVSICDAASQPSPQSNVAESFEQEFALGENSMYKGFEHVLDDLPEAAALEVEGGLPSEFDLRSKFAMCFPDAGGRKYTEVVRNQGRCGSCWAFAAASMTAHNLCISGKGSHMMNSPGDRTEVSVQKIMSCKVGGRHAAGCKGGNVGRFAGAVGQHGLTKEKSNRYACGRGNPKHHFQKTNRNCGRFPWGGQCTGKREAAWHWDGAVRAPDEKTMMSYVAQGYALYTRFWVYSEFFRYRSGVYHKASGKRRGGHAMVVVGYGTQNGMKYWNIQNSWGPRWGDKGYVKFLRGKNFCGIEGGAVMGRAWVSGGKMPPCEDAKNSGIGRRIGRRFVRTTCSAIKQYRVDTKKYFCKKYRSVRTNCKATCGKCPVPKKPAATTTTTTTKGSSIYGLVPTTTAAPPAPVTRRRRAPKRNHRRRRSARRPRRNYSRRRSARRPKRRSWGRRRRFRRRSFRRRRRFRRRSFSRRSARRPRRRSWGRRGRFRRRSHRRRRRFRRRRGRSRGTRRRRRR
eukprot:TRINITY_DN2689_c0_g2_i1.p1 TRINITY_DN2689_c0_g2~~TRINITY_DN2689_c0_g2_i1.p1  ORF type:complete len:817 (+),score=131.20 TRINITY_DN2689_c0_g2_i1:93-2543(+)